MQTRSIPGPWHAGERILVSVGPSPLSERLVRTAGGRQTGLMQTGMQSTSRPRLITGSQRRAKEQVWRTLQLAEKLGATTATVFGLNVADTAIEYAKKHNITQDYHRKNAPTPLAGICFWIRGRHAYP